MFLSRLRVNANSEPDRPNPGRDWLRNLYHVHQRLCMAFPSSSRASGDPDFLGPYTPADFPEGRYQADKKKTEVPPDELKQVHAKRDGRSNFLFRIDPLPGGNAAILVQSALKPDWDYAFHNARFLLATDPESKMYDPTFANGQSLRFRLVANPTRKIDTKSGPDGQRRNGKRVPVKYEKLPEWLDHQGERGGFKVEATSCACQPGYVYVGKPREAGSQRLFSVRFDGLLRVTDADAFRQTLISGVGSAKAFGFGLLSLAPAQP